jgi:hypothetical protein
MVAYYRAGTGGDQNNRNIFVGGLGGWQGRLLIAPVNNLVTIANANSFGPLSAALVVPANFTNNNQIATVSGLTACIGVILVREVAHHQLGTVVVAHFNGGYNHAPSWLAIANGIGGAGGARYAIVIATSDTTGYGMTGADGVMQSFRANLTGPPLNVPDDNQIYYWSNTSGVEFGITRQGFIGEPNPKLHEF